MWLADVTDSRTDSKNNLSFLFFWGGMVRWEMRGGWHSMCVVLHQSCARTAKLAQRKCVQLPTARKCREKVLVVVRKKKVSEHKRLQIARVHAR